jgi:hypothetical protein
VLESPEDVVQRVLEYRALLGRPMAAAGVAGGG